MVLPDIGSAHPGHKHPFDHLTLLAKGSLSVTVDGQSTEYVAPSMILIAKDQIHELTALVEDTVFYCIHGIRDENGMLIDPELIPAGSNAVSIQKQPGIAPLYEFRNDITVLGKIDLTVLDNTEFIAQDITDAALQSIPSSVLGGPTAV